MISDKRHYAAMADLITPHMCLLAAILKDDVTAMNVALAAGAKLDARMNDAFCHAVKCRALACLEHMFVNGVDPMIVSGLALRTAAENNDAGMFDLVMSHDPDMTDSGAITTLAIAARTGNVDFVRALVEAGIDIHDRYDQAVYVAFTHQKWDCMREILMGDPRPDPLFNNHWSFNIFRSMPDDLLFEWQSGQLAAESAARAMERETKQREYAGRTKALANMGKDVRKSKRDALSLTANEIATLLCVDPYGRDLYDFSFPKIVQDRQRHPTAGAVMSRDGDVLTVPSKMSARHKFEAAAEALGAYYVGISKSGAENHSIRKRLDHILAVRFHVTRKMTHHKLWDRISPAPRNKNKSPRLIF
ncbi:MAG: ankyrin repeat domain-containing protein [Pseudomonadota bacterium]|nr:ankyrin repeat domain-containing protein [Pseudomonadota bacterium]